jgi:methylglyoxal synthase
LHTIKRKRRCWIGTAFNKTVLARHELMATGTTGNCVVACGPATADFVLNSPLMSSDYEAVIPDYSEYLHRRIEK